MVFLDPIKRFADFNGRSNRAEFWSFALFEVALYVLLLIIDNSGMLFVLAFLVLIVPGISVTVRRLHDTDKSGWMILLGLIPLANLWLLVLYLTPGNTGDNNYGAPHA